MDISVLASGKSSTAYNKAGRHRDFNKCTHTSSDSEPAFLTLYKIALTER